MVIMGSTLSGIKFKCNAKYNVRSATIEMYTYYSVCRWWTYSQNCELQFIDIYIAYHNVNDETITVIDLWWFNRPIAGVVPLT